MRKLLAVLLLLALFLPLTGCVNMAGGDPDATPLPALTEPLFSDKESVYGLYNQLEFTDSLNDVKAKIGEPTSIDNEGKENPSLNWVDDQGHGVAAAFSGTGKMLGKVLYYADYRQIFGLMDKEPNMDDASTIEENMSKETVIGILGTDGAEIARVPLDDSVDPDLVPLMMWVNQRGDVAQILFNKEGLVSRIQYSYAIVETPSPEATQEVAE